MCKQLLLHTARFTLIYKLVLLKRKKKFLSSTMNHKKITKMKKILIKNLISNY